MAKENLHGDSSLAEGQIITTEGAVKDAASHKEQDEGLETILQGFTKDAGGIDDMVTAPHEVAIPEPLPDSDAAKEDVADPDAATEVSPKKTTKASTPKKKASTAKKTASTKATATKTAEKSETPPPDEDPGEKTDADDIPLGVDDVFPLPKSEEAGVVEKGADDSAGADSVEPDLLAEAQQAALWDGAPVEEPVLLAESEDEGVGDEEGVEEGFTPPPGSEDSPPSGSVVSRGEQIITKPNAFAHADEVPDQPAKPRGRRGRSKSQEPDSAGTSEKVPSRAADIVTVNRGSFDYQWDREGELWHNIKNAQFTRRTLTGILDGVEPLESRAIIATINYEGLRIAMSMKEVGFDLDGTTGGKLPSINRARQLLNNMLNAKVDFVVKGTDDSDHSIVGSRREAMLRKRRNFYLTPDDRGNMHIREGRVVEARIIAVAEKVVRVEVFGVETNIFARNMSWEWLGDAREYYRVGDNVLVRVRSIESSDINLMTIEADAKSVTRNTVAENLKKVKVQGKYAGVITDVYRGVVFIRLNLGVNAIAHSCVDIRRPGKKDIISFAVTHIDNERNVAVGLITRIIKQNI